MTYFRRFCFTTVPGAL